VPIYEHTTEFAGKPVVEWTAGIGISDPTGTRYRITLTCEEAEPPKDWKQTIAGLFSRRAAPPPPPKMQWGDKLAAFLEDPAASQVTGLVVGAWGPTFEDENGSRSVVEALVAARERLPRLTALFLGDIVGEECEISWIRQTDISPLFTAYPALEHFCVRGAEDLSLGTLRHERLKSLIVQSGGLPARVVREVAAADLPELEHLELWLGTDDYGGNGTVTDLAPILSGERFPKLRTLGLRDSVITDEIAAAVASAPILERIRVLDLSLGTLGDRGAEALLASPAVARLEKLDIHHHYCSEPMVVRLQALGLDVDASEPQEPDGDDEDGRYVAVSE
jgi:hypothetical protein